MSVYVFLVFSRRLIKLERLTLMGVFVTDQQRICWLLFVNTPFKMV